MQLFGLDITGDHARIIFAALGGVAAATGFVAGRWSKHRDWMLFKSEDLVTTTMVIELYGITRGEDGRDTLHIISQGTSLDMDEFFRSPDLVRHIQRAAARHPGLVCLRNPVAHRMMMDEGKDAITGLDARGNMDFVHGRPVREDTTLFGFAAYRELDHDRSGLHDQIARLVLMVVSPAIMEQMADADYARTLAVAHSGYRPRCDRLLDFAREWKRLATIPAAERTSATDKIWSITVRTALS